MRSFALNRARQAECPSIFQDIAQTIGKDSTAKLVERYGGGQRLYIPSRIRPGHDLYELLGENVAKQLAKEFCGLSVEVPLNAALLRVQRNRQIMADFANGKTQSELARIHKMTLRNVRNIVAANSIIKQKVIS